MEEDNIVIRYAKEEELEQVNNIRRQVNELHCSGRPDIFKSGGWEYIKDIVYEKFKSEDSGVIVALKGQEVVGAAVVQYIHKQESAFGRERWFYHVEEFGVDVNHRRQGIATGLMEFMKKDAKSRGFGKLELDMWEFNEGALKFYENVGFTTYRRYMELRLDEKL